MTMETKPTAGAQRAMGLAELVNKVFAKERIPSSLEGHAGYRVEMAGPETLSTSARQGALDHLKLVPLDPKRIGVGAGAGATLLIFSLAVLTTLTAVRSVAKRNIAVLLMGTNR